MEVFVCLETQWRIAPAGGAVGLDYAAIAPVVRMLGLEEGPALFRDLRIMERAALDALRAVSHDRSRT